MKNKVFSLLLVLCLMVCVLPLSVSALEDKEANNTAGVAQRVSFGDIISGSIHEVGDVDFYKIVLSKSGRVSLDMTSYMRWYQLYLYDTAGTQLWAADWYLEWNATVGFRSDKYTVDLAAGTYYIKVTGFRNYQNDGSVGTYTLGVGYTGAGVTETSSNDSVADADPVTLGKTVKGQIAINDRYDFFKIVLPSSGRITLDMTSYMQWYQLYLYDTDGVQLWAADWYNEWNATVGFRKDVHNIDLLAGTYYVKVTGYRNYSNEGSTGTYKLATAFKSAGVTEKKVNDSLADAESLSLYGSVVGQIAINDRYDFFTFTVPNLRKVRLDVTSYMHWYQLYLYDVNGNQVWCDDWYNEWNGTVGYRSDTYEIDLVAGSYYLKVTGYRNYSDEGSTGTYKIILNHLARPDVKISGVTASGKNKLTWGAVEDAAKYDVYRSTSKTTGYKKIDTVTDTSYTDKTATAGKNYYYKVYAVDAYGHKSEASSVVNRMCDLARPEISVKAVASSGKNRVSWNAISGAKSYQVYRSTSNGGTYKLIKTTTSTSYTDTSVVAGKNYYYKVRAVCSNSSGNSAYSLIKNRVCDLKQPVIYLSNVASNGKPRVTWKAVDGAVSYKLYRATSKTGTYKLLKTTTSTGYTDTSTKAGKVYYYKLVAVCSESAGNSAASAVKYLRCDLYRPSVSGALTSGGTPRLTWKAITGAVSYKVYRSTSQDGDYKLVKTTTSTKFTDTSAVAGRTYYYKVVAVHSTTAASSAHSVVVKLKAK